jgi:hypothetical protein
VDEAGGEYHHILMRQLAEAKLKDEREVAARIAASERNASQLQDQLSDTRQRYMARLVQEKHEGELVIEKSRQEVIEDAEKAAERSLQARMACEEMTLANQKLKKLQLELSLKDAEEEARRLALLRSKEATAVARKQLEAQRFMDKQAIRQRLIDRACEELAAKSNEDHRIQEKQAEEARSKEDAELAARAAKRDRQRDAIAKSRAEVVAVRAAERARDEAEAAERFRMQTTKVAQMEREEVEKKLVTLRRARECRAAVESQIADKAVWKDVVREHGLREDAQTKAVLDEDEGRFQRIAYHAYEEAAAEGKNTIPIQKAMFAKTITLLPASVSMRL